MVILQKKFHRLVFPDARYQRCTVHFYRNIFSVTPRNKMKAVAMMLKAIHAQAVSYTHLVPISQVPS